MIVGGFGGLGGGGNGGEGRDETLCPPAILSKSPKIASEKPQRLTRLKEEPAKVDSIEP